jgi:hypothetical protein
VELARATSLPQEKLAPWFCPWFASTQSHQVNVRRGPKSATRLKRLACRRISRRTRGDHSAQRRQVLISASTDAGISLIERARTAPCRLSPCIAALFNLVRRAKTTRAATIPPQGV